MEQNQISFVITVPVDIIEKKHKVSFVVTAPANIITKKHKVQALVKNINQYICLSDRRGIIVSASAQRLKYVRRLGKSYVAGCFLRGERSPDV